LIWPCDQRVEAALERFFALQHLFVGGAAHQVVLHRARGIEQFAELDLVAHQCGRRGLQRADIVVHAQARPAGGDEDGQGRASTSVSGWVEKRGQRAARPR
jgi:hypothetical protein